MHRQVVASFSSILSRTTEISSSVRLRKTKRPAEASVTSLGYSSGIYHLFSGGEGAFLVLWMVFIAQISRYELLSACSLVAKPVVV